MPAMEYAKFLHRFSNNMLPGYFKNYLDDLETVHQHNTRQKAKKNFFHAYARTEWGKIATCSARDLGKIILRTKIFLQDSHRLGKTLGG